MKKAVGTITIHRHSGQGVYAYSAEFDHEGDRLESNVYDSPQEAIVEVVNRTTIYSDNHLILLRDCK